MAQHTTVTESYIVRIYRRGEAAFGGIAGLVELPDQDTRVPFRSFPELQAILESDPRTSAHGKNIPATPGAAGAYRDVAPGKKK